MFILFNMNKTLSILIAVALLETFLFIFVICLGEFIPIVILTLLFIWSWWMVIVAYIEHRIFLRDENE